MVVNEFVMTTAGFFGAITVIFGGLYSVYRLVRKLDMAIGTDDGGKTISERLSKVEHQLWENGGTSLADRVNRIESRVNHTATETSLIKEILLSSITAQPQVPAPRRARQKKTSGVTTASAFGLSTVNLDEE